MTLQVWVHEDGVIESITTTRLSREEAIGAILADSELTPATRLVGIHGITTGVPGTALDIAQELGIDRSTVRTALMALAGKGWTTRTSGRWQFPYGPQEGS